MNELNIPNWVNWIAQDANGKWWGYSAEPHCFHQGWYENEVGKTVFLAEGSPNPDWQETLQHYTGQKFS